MRNVIWIIVIATFVNFVSGCVPPPLYRNWASQIIDMPNHHGKVEDISALINTEPTRCDPITDPQPMIGVTFGDFDSEIKRVSDDGPAYKAGIRVGDRITSVNDQHISSLSSLQTIAILDANKRDGKPLNLGTNRGAFVVIPETPEKVEQCYWDVSGGLATMPDTGTAGSAPETYQRYLRVSCRVHDGYIYVCTVDTRG